MEETKNLCVQIPIALHNRVREEQERAALTLSQYMTKLLTQYYENGGTTMTNTKTIAFQIPEELFQRLKDHLAQEAERTGYKISQRKFIVGLIEQALGESDTAAVSETASPDNH